MSEANKSFQHQANKKGVLGVEDNLWSVLAILSLLGCCGRRSFAVLYNSPVPQNNFEIHCFLKVILINMFPKIHAVSFPKFQTHRVVMGAGLTYCRT